VQSFEETQPTMRSRAATVPVERVRRSRRGLRAADVLRTPTAPTSPPRLVTAARPPRSSRWLRTLLFGLDVLALTLGWVLTLVLPAVLSADSESLGRLAGTVAVIVAASLLVISWQGLYLARVCGVKAVETVRLGRAAVFSAVVGLLVSPAIDQAISLQQAVAAVVVTFLLLVTARGLYGSWLRRSRLQGRFCRPMVIVGTGDEGFELYRLLELHPELGFRVAGVVGPEREAQDWQMDLPWLGEVPDTATAVQASGANGVVVAASDLASEDLNRVTRELLHAGIHVHLSSGLRGIDHRRLRSLPLAHEPLFYLEPVSLSRWQYVAKRAVDLVLATLGLLLVSPVLLVAAIAIKLQDRGPVFFRQTRVGRGGAEFTLLKLRTMVPDAEQQQDELARANQRQGGPLFKLDRDPRRTAVGRILERASIDELPQLVNVLRGEMSLVGPRPALPHEVEEFDEELLGRQSVPPGITGLWQVEGRDNPAFDVYRRLDLFYVENWSVGLDFAIMLGTAQAVLGRIGRVVTHLGHRSPAA
jgi:exopolysaccharide biosynthesis polyprenyl glycosylphosphotransferase